MFGHLTPWVKRLIVANVLVFLVQQFALPGLAYSFDFWPVQALQRPWTFVTYMFLHAGWWHLAFNMLTLYFFGPKVEAQLEGRRFITLYFVSGITGAVLYSFTSHNPMVGASGAIFGVQLAYATYWPHDRIYIWGVLPVEARLMVVLTTIYSVYAGMGTSGGGIAHFAHLGGYVGAFLYLRWIDFRSPLRSYQRKLDTATYGKRAWSEGLVGENQELARWERIPREGLHRMNVEEIDRVLEKARSQGTRSLTPDERAFMHRMTLRGEPNQSPQPGQDGTIIPS